MSQRKALVIGNDTYRGNHLENARNDARAVAAKLKQLGYTTTLALDVDRPRLVKSIETFSSSLEHGDDALVYYAGHGVQVNGENMLVPTDFVTADEAGIEHAGYPLSSVLAHLVASRARAKIILLDACRNNPYRNDRSLPTGWSPMQTSADTYLAFGTAPGQTASDDSQDGHGMFTSAFLRHMSDPVDIDLMFRAVRLEVVKTSEGKQIPWASSSLVDSFHLDPALDRGSSNVFDQIGLRGPDLIPSSLVARSVSNLPRDSPTTRRDQSRDVGVLTTAACAEMRSLHFAEALQILAEILAVDPHVAFALRTSGLILHLLNQHEQGQLMLRRAVVDHPGDSAALADFCLFTDQKLYSTECRTRLHSHQEVAAAHLAVALHSIAAGDRDEAFGEVSAAITLQPDSAAALMLRGDIALATHQNAAAERDLGRANEVVLSRPRAVDAAR